MHRPGNESIPFLGFCAITPLSIVGQTVTRVVACWPVTEDTPIQAGEFLEYRTCRLIQS